MSRLADRVCEPCQGGMPPLTTSQIRELHAQIPEWEVIHEGGIDRLQRSFRFADFAQALDFTLQVGELAESENHHPAILTEWGHVRVSWWTHVVGGLHLNDFIMAARTERLFQAI